MIEDNPDVNDETTFAALGLSERLLKTLEDVGYERPSPIQAATIPALLSGRDVVGLAQTGTGKTAAFALPILEHIDPKKPAPQALVLAPTRELALQVCEAFQTYAKDMGDIRILPVYGGKGYAPQLSALARGVHIVVGTPGRLIDHLNSGKLKLGDVKYLVIDEADEMLAMGFSDDVERILADTPEDRQVALFSATMPPAIKKLSRRYLSDPLEFLVKGKTATAPNVKHRYISVAHQQKVDALTRILEVETFEAMIVFVRTKSETEELAGKLRARGFSAAAINGDNVQAQRERTVEQLRAGELDILVATDVAARGLDVERISHVINYDIPTDPESYIHRVGRTGRAGRSGDAISFVTPRERRLLGMIEKATRQALTQMEVPSAEDINASRLSRFDAAITESLGSDRLEFFRQVVGHYVKEYDVPETDVAAALALKLQGDEPMLLDPDSDPQPDSRADRRERTAGRTGRRPDRPTREGRSGMRAGKGRFGGRDSEYGKGDRSGTSKGRFDDRGDSKYGSDDRSSRGGSESGHFGSTRGSGFGDANRFDKPRHGTRAGRGRTVSYHLPVGKKDGVSAGQVVAALTARSDLRREDVGQITIGKGSTVIELPAGLDRRARESLRGVRIAGRKLGSPDRGA